MNYTKPKTFVIHKNDAGTDAYRDQYVHALEAEIERLRAIVDKLPKCWRLNEQGELVQDEPIISGNWVWTLFSDGCVAGPYMVLAINCRKDYSINLSLGEFQTKQLFSTREAAEAAKEE